MTSTTDRDNLRGALDPYLGNPQLPRAIRDLCDAAHDAEDIEATMQRTGAALVAIETHADWTAAAGKKLRAALLTCMAETGAPNIVLAYHTIGTQERRAMHINEAEIPAAFMKPPSPPSPDTEAIRKALAAGETVPGATLGNGSPTLFIRARNKT